jgi:transglutaminase-like putative cysteine protease
VFSPELRKAVAEAVGDEVNPLARARRVFFWVDQHIAYNLEEEYCLIPSLSAKALASRRGDCGVQGMLFITMCRCAGIPARWQSGWESKPVGWNMHDWAEFYVEPWGWLPADASYGLQKSDDPRVREFYLGHQDSYRMIVNRDYGCALMPQKKSLRSEPADFQRGEVEIDGKNLYFSEWDYQMTFEWGK